jgi:hypothetical protein
VLILQRFKLPPMKSLPASERCAASMGRDQFRPIPVRQFTSAAFRLAIATGWRKAILALACTLPLYN